MCVVNDKAILILSPMVDIRFATLHIDILILYVTVKVRRIGTLDQFCLFQGWRLN